MADDARAAASRADRLARLRAQAGAASSRQAAAAEEIERLTVSAEQARTRAEQAQQEHSQVQELVSGHDEGRAELAASHEEASAVLAEATGRVAELRTAEQEATRHYTALRARVDALQEAFRRGADASAALLTEPGRFSGVIGPFAEALTVEEGAQTAVAAALGAAADAVAVTDLDAATAILAALRESGDGAAGLVVAGRPGARRQLMPATRAPGPTAHRGRSCRPGPATPRTWSGCPPIFGRRSWNSWTGSWSAPAWSRRGTCCARNRRCAW